MHLLFNIAKKTLSLLGTLVGGFFILLFLIAMSPIIIGALVIFGSIAIYSWLWARIRHDPKVDLNINTLPPEEWGTATTKEAFTDAFDAVVKTITELSHAQRSKKEFSGFSFFDRPDPTIDWTDLNISQDLHTEHARLRLSFDFGAYYNESSGKIFVDTRDGDDHLPGSLPPILATIVEPKLHIERRFMIHSCEDLWTVVSFLRGKIKFTHEGGQLWAFIPEHDVWLVQYKINKSDYGLRAKFENNIACEYNFDRKPKPISISA